MSYNYMYSIIASLSILLCGHLVEYFAKRDKSKVASHVWEIILMAVFFGVIGARLYHVIHLWSFYSNNISQIFNFRAGGLGIYGGVIGGAIGALLGSFVHRVSFKQFIDFASITLPLGQALGRWGNYFNFELYGKPFEGAFKLYIPLEHRLPGFEAFDFFYPLFLYESVLNFILFAGLFYLWKFKKIKAGDLNFIFLYLLFYGIIRLILEPLKIGVWEYNEVPVATIISIVLILISLLFFVIRYIKKINGYIRR